MSKINIDEVSVEAKELISSSIKNTSAAEHDRKLAAPKLRLVWQALEAKQPVSGCKTKKEWAEKFAKVDVRTCQYILKGKRDRSAEVKKRDANHVVRLKPGMVVSIGNVQYDQTVASVLVKIEQSRQVKYQGKRRGGDVNLAEDNGNTPEAFAVLKKEDKVVWTHTVREVYGDLVVTVENEDGTMTEQLIAALHKKMTATLKSMCLWDAKLTEEFNASVKDCTDWYEEQAAQRSQSAKKAAEIRKKKSQHVKEVESQIRARNGNGGHKPAAATKPVDPAKELNKRFRIAKRAAKFYCGMMKELSDGVDGEYDRLLDLYSDSERRGDHRYPWTVPTEGYELPKTQKKFQAEYDKANGEFHAVVAEVEAYNEKQTAMHPSAQKLEETLSATDPKTVDDVPKNIAPQILEVVKRRKAWIMNGDPEDFTGLEKEAL